MTIRRGYLALSFGQLHYRYAGRPGAPVLLLLHQTPSSSVMYEALMRQLAGDFRLLAPDTPGMGESDPMPGKLSIASVADGIAEFLDELGVQHCHVFGHHTGAAIAVQMAAANPHQVDTLALSGPPLLSDELRERLPSLAAPIAPDAEGKHLLAMWQRIRAKDPNAPIDIVERETIAALRLGKRYAEAYDAVIEQDFAALLGQVRCPVLAIAGTKDPLHGQLDEVLEAVSSGVRDEIEGERTFVCETSAEQVAGLLRRFFMRKAA